MKQNKTILFFDGVCNLCNSTIDFFINKDKDNLFRYSPLQGKTADELLDNKRTQDLDTVVLYHQGKVYIKSKAILKSLILLGFPYNILGVFIIIPRFISDFFYDLIAKNRYKLFGQKETCRLPSAEEKELFLD